MDNITTCVALGGLISFVVSLLKSVPIVKKYPKWTSFVLSSVFPVILNGLALWKGHDFQSIQDILVCVSTQFTAAVTAHETVAHTINKTVFTS